jgi:hypothetical protein
MSTPYRSWEELREIICAVAADSNPRPLSSFAFQPGEEEFFRARTARAVGKAAQSCSQFTAYYEMPTEKPFRRVQAISTTILLLVVLVGIELFIKTRDNPAYPVFAALIATAAAAAGWWVVGGISHANTIRQNTNTLLFARFSQAPFGEAMHRFHSEFKYGLDSRATRDQMMELINSGDEEKLKAASSVAYMLNYFEFVASGVLRGDLDARIVEENIKGFLSYFYDKCEPFIRSRNFSDPEIYEHLIKIRAHYREP